MSTWLDKLDDIIANPSKYRDRPIEIVMDTDRVVAYEGDPEYDEGFHNELMTVKLNDEPTKEHYRLRFCPL